MGWIIEKEIVINYVNSLSNTQKIITKNNRIIINIIIYNQYNNKDKTSNENNIRTSLFGKFLRFCVNQFLFIVTNFGYVN